MKKSLFCPLVCALGVAACSTDKPAESAYDTYDSSTVAEADKSHEPLVPASSDATSEPTPTTAPRDEATRSAANPPDPAVPADITKADNTKADNTKADNTKVNERDQSSSALTPIDQGENASDLKITQEIRKAVVGDGSLSFTAKNVKIITVNGKVTLRGPVNTAAERATIEAAARKVAGAGRVDNQLEVAK
jgi:osmotically-inducible protein OsmY